MPLDDFKFDFDPHQMGIPEGDNPEQPNRVIDADTVIADGTKVRLQGIGAREVARTDQQQKDGLLDKLGLRGADAFKQGDYGGEEQSDAVRKIINDAGGIDRAVLTRDSQGNPIKTHDRAVGDVLLKDGSSLRQRVIEGRLAPLVTEVGKGKEGATSEDFSQQAWGDIQRQQRKKLGVQSLDDKLLEGLTQHDRAAWGGQTLVGREKALTAAQFGQDQSYYSQSGPAIQRSDETRTGEARGTGFEAGWKSGVEVAKQGLYGLAEMLSPKGSDAEMWAKAQGEVSKENQQDLAHVKRFLDSNGDLNLHSVGDYTNWLVGNFAQSAPLMGVIMASSAFAPAGLIAGTTVSVGVPSLMFAGSVYADQEEGEKDAGRALVSGVAQAALEKVGLAASGLFTKPLDLLTKDGVKKAAAALAKQNGVSTEVAEKTILSTIKQTSADTAKGMAHFVGNSAKAFAGEASTEVGQTALEHWGKTGDVDLSNIETRRELFESGIAGGGIGLGLHGPTAAFQKLTTRPEGSAGKKSSTDVIARDIIAADKTIGAVGYIPTVRELAAEAEDSGQSLEELAAPRQAEEDKFKWGIFSRVGDSLKRNGINDVWQSWAASTFGGDSTFRGKWSSALSDMLGFTKHLNGGDIDTNRDLIEAKILSNFGTQQEVENRFGLSRQDIGKLYNNTRVVTALKFLNAKALGDPRPMDVLAKEIGFEKMLGENAPYAKALIDTQVGINAAAKSFQSEVGQEMTGDQVLDNRPFNKEAIRARKDEFVKLVAEELQITASQAAQATEKLISRMDVDNLADALQYDDDSVVNYFDDAKISPKLVKELANIDTDKFGDFLAGNIFDNIASMASRGGSLYVNKHYISKVPALISSAIRDGEMTPEQGAFVAQQIKHYIQKQRGEFHPMSQAAKNVLSGLGFFTSAAVLPMAAISSLGEFAQIHRSLDPTKTELGRDFMKLVGHSANELASAFSDIPNHIGGTKRYATEGQRKLLEAGFGQQTNLARNDIMRGAFDTATMRFFKYTGLEAVTNATRLVRLGLADDAINNWMNTYQSDPLSEAGKTAREQLVRIGFKPEYWSSKFNVGPLSAADQAMFERDMQLARFGFVNEAVIQPSALNRPKFYSDPYLRIFTILQGYSSTFTAKLLPRLVKDLGARGTEEQRDAIRTVAVAAAMAALAVAAKESIKEAAGGLGDDDEDKKKKKYQINETTRFVNQWGLLGQGQLAYNAFFPMIKERYKFSEEPVNYMISKLSDTSPMGNYLGSVSKAIESIGESGSGKKIAAAVPGGAVFKHLGILQ